MKKLIGIFAFFVLFACASTWILWERKAAILSHFISKHLGDVPVQIEQLNIAKQSIDINHLWIGSFPNSRVSTSFSAQKITSTLETRKILSDPLIIDQIYIEDISVGIEYYQDGKTNWSYMLENGESAKPGDRNYLIRTLVLDNLNVEVTQADGRKKRYPKIRRIVFHNISNETGIPINEIEKAIFKLMMKDIMDKFNLLLKPLDLQNQLLPRIFQGF